MGHLVFLTGPVRSGKSRRAVDLALAWGQRTVFVATYRAGAPDEEMSARVKRHRADRPDWRTLEAPWDVPRALAAIDPPPSAVVLDCLTLWLADRLDCDDVAVLAGWDRVLATFRDAAWPSVIVGNEVGWGVVPESPETRRFRDLAGALAQRTAEFAQEAWLYVAGCGIRLK